MILTYKYRLLPTKAQHGALESLCEDQQQLYNGALQERIDCYKKTGKSLSLIDQQKSVTQLRKDAEFSKIPANIQRWTLKKLDEAFKGFFRRLKTNQKAGFPRFKGKDRFKSFGFNEFSGITLKNNRLYFKGMPGSLRIHLHRDLPGGKPKSCVIRKDHKGWYVCLAMDVEVESMKPIVTMTGIDMGITSLVTLANGEELPNPGHLRKAEKEFRRKQRKVSRCKRGSSSRAKAKQAVAKLHQKIKNKRETHLHQISAKLIKQYDLIAVEKLQIRNMIKNHHLAKSIADVSWTKLKKMLLYKAEKAGKTVVEVDPKYTSQICSGCGAIVEKTLAQRQHDCPHCGIWLDRDHNAALNILHAAVLSRGVANVGAVRPSVYPEISFGVSK